MAILLAILSSLCFGMALVTGRVGLRTLDARSGAAISIPSAAVLFVAAAPFAFDFARVDLRAVLLFAVVGLFFPAVVTLLTFRSNALLGPTTTGAVSGTAPLFALIGAAFFLGERVPDEAAVSAVGVVAGIALLSWKQGGNVRSTFVGWSLLWPVAGAVVRGLAQVGAKAGLLMWASPYAASLIGYVVSCAAVLGADRLRSNRPKRTKEAILWFGVTGVLNGSAVLLMYAALGLAPVWMVAPLVASYPLVTTVATAALLREETVSLQAVAGAALTVAAVVYLVASQGI